MLGICQVAEKGTLGEIHKDPAGKKAVGNSLEQAVAFGTQEISRGVKLGRVSWD